VAVFITDGGVSHALIGTCVVGVGTGPNAASICAAAATRSPDHAIHGIDFSKSMKVDVPRGGAGLTLRSHLPTGAGLTVGSTSVYGLLATPGDHKLGEVAGGVEVPVGDHAAGVAGGGPDPQRGSADLYASRTPISCASSPRRTPG
jgi:hypothetical protein